MKKIFCIVLILLTIIGFNYYNFNRNRSLSNKEWIEDINVLSSSIKSSHPDPFMYISEKEWDKNLDDIKKNLYRLSDSQILMELSHTVSTLKDMHTFINPLYVVNPIGEEFSYDNMEVFPIQYEWFGDELRVISCDSKYKDLLGSELLSINDVSLNDVIDKISKMYPFENNQGTKSQSKEYVSLYELLKFLDIVDSEVANFVFKTSSGETKSIDLNTMKITEIEFISLENNFKNTINEPPENSNKEYWCKYIKEDKTLYFQYNACVNKSSSWVPDEKNRNNYPDFYAFVDNLISELNSHPIDKFVIDLSNNSGGTLGLTNYMISRIENETSIKENTKTYIISGGNTLSAGVWSIVDIANHFDTTVVGEETGSNVNTTNVTYNNFELPNSKIQVNCGSNFINKIPGYKGGYKPDVEIIQDYKNYQNGIYNAYEYIKNDKIN